MDTLDSIIDKALSRRSFLAGAGAVAASTMVAGCSNGTVTLPPTPTAGVTDTDILNYALNLEYLEATFYLYAATGAGLQAADTTPGSSSATTVGTVTATGVTAVPTTSAVEQDFINELAYTEQQHVRLLRSALGPDAVAIPAIDLTFFGPLATAASITLPNNATFSPFGSFDAFLVGAFIFEDVGVTAYSGGATLISSPTVLSDAAAILSVEAYHAGAIRTLLTARAIAAGSQTAYPYLGFANQVSTLRQTLTVGATPSVDAGNVAETPLTFPTSTGLGTATGTTTPSGIVAASSQNAIGFARTPSQVHSIAYGNSTVGTKGGGFFPNGTNSIFNVITAPAS